MSLVNTITSFLNKSKVWNYVFWILITLGIGFASSQLIPNSEEFYQQLSLPSFAPPAWLFGVVWTVIYILMGISVARISSLHEKDASVARALRLYLVQLVVNFMWPIIFFRYEALFLAFVWILLLLVLVIKMYRMFKEIDPVSALLLIPYILWLLFATYLNFGILVLN